VSPSAAGGCGAGNRVVGSVKRVAVGIGGCARLHRVTVMHMRVRVNQPGRRRGRAGAVARLGMPTRPDRVVIIFVRVGQPGRRHGRAGAVVGIRGRTRLNCVAVVCGACGSANRVVTSGVRAPSPGAAGAGRATGSRARACARRRPGRRGQVGQPGHGLGHARAVARGSGGRSANQVVGSGVRAPSPGAVGAGRATGSRARACARRRPGLKARATKEQTC
jgi:hypothetical protein